MQLVTEIIYAIYHAVHVDRFICHYIRLQMPKILPRNNINMNIKFLVVYFLYDHQDGAQSGKTICHQDMMSKML